MSWQYFLIATAVAHVLSAVYLAAQSKETKWAVKGLFFGLIAVYLYKKSPSLS